MDFELRVAREKLEREQRAGKERAKAKRERERRAKAEAVRQRDAIEAAQRSKRLDAARAQIEAEHRMEESMLLGKGVIFYRTLEAIPFNGFGDKIKLPPSCFQELSDQGALDKGPMYFRLSLVDESVPSVSDATNEGEHRATHSGVLEFTAREGSVELPSHVWSNLLSGVSLDVPLVEVRYVSLPKGTYAKLQPDGMGFSDIPNHKAVLETTLRRHATLSQGDIITVSYGELNYKLRVLETKPASSVSVLETDIEVDIEGHDSAQESSRNQPVLAPLVIGKVEEGIVEEGTFNYYKFSVEAAMIDEVASGRMNIEVKIEADAGDGDTNVYLSRHPLIFPTQHRHEWSSHEMGSKVLTVRPKDPSLVAGTYSIGVFGFKGVTKYHISVAFKDNVKQKIGGHATVSSPIDMESVECRNCKHFISSQTILLHEAYCLRHNVLCRHNGCGVVLRKEEAANHVHCNKCGQAFQQGQIEKHMKVFHEPVHCPCGVILEKEQMIEHQSSTCPLRLIMCRFCGDMVQAGSTPADARDRLRGLFEHESICGSRTAPCDSCGRAIMLKEMDIHVIAVHQKS
ncbi:C2H2 zinc finger protein [Musa troglodytarum]|uniref:C2H2 zinc finger protein n=1 Tax=Musa troglodytarum TaxID=320322 RepID=A0A9E7EFI0_9LILI|nr:C2H2 zinc finger protein [Musa troglodytarum]